MISSQYLKLVTDPHLIRELEWLHKRLNEVFTKGEIELDRTLTPAGTTGDQTINKLAGTVRIAAGGSSVLVRNNHVDEDSLVLAVIQTDDSTAILKNVVPSDGEFTIKTTAAVTAETRVGFMVFN